MSQNKQTHKEAQNEGQFVGNLYVKAAIVQSSHGNTQLKGLTVL